MSWLEVVGAVGAIAAAVALIPTGIGVWLQLREHRRRQARAVHSWVECVGDAATLVVENSSDGAIYDLIWSDGVPQEHWAAAEIVHGGYAHVVPAGARRTFEGPFYAPFSEDPLVLIDFVDADGRRWTRRGSELTRVRRSSGYRQRYPFLADDPLISLS